MNIKLGTKCLFNLLVKTLRPELVCDIGSMDGSDARRFRRQLPNARIVAFEANSQNVRSMQEDKGILKDRIEIQHKAVSNHNGNLTFYVENISAGGEIEDVRCGISSIRKRHGNSLGNRRITVESVRLDTFIQNLDVLPESIALWIDVEGAAYEALEGIEQIRERVKVIHVEVETKEFWKGQRLKTDVEALIKSMGFTILARGRFEEQHDLVLINSRTFLESPFKFKFIVYLAFVLTERLRIFKKIGGISKVLQQ